MFQADTEILWLFKSMTIVELIFMIIGIVGAIRGSNVGWVFTFLIGAIVVVFINMIVRTKNTICELRERRGETLTGKDSNRISGYLAAGMILNAVTQLMRDRIPTVPWRCIAICAIILMVIGICQTAKMRKQV